MKCETTLFVESSEWIRRNAEFRYIRIWILLQEANLAGEMVARDSMAKFKPGRETKQEATASSAVFFY